MAKIEVRFLDVQDDCYAELHQIDGIISIYLNDEDARHNGVCIHLDKSTAIKFAKTLRTEINKIQD